MIESDSRLAFSYFFNPIITKKLSHLLAEARFNDVIYSRFMSQPQKTMIKAFSIYYTRLFFFLTFICGFGKPGMTNAPREDVSYRYDYGNIFKSLTTWEVLTINSEINVFFVLFTVILWIFQASHIIFNIEQKRAKQSLLLNLSPHSYLLLKQQQ